MGHDWNGASCLVLHTTGRKSGQTRKLALIYGRDGNDYLLVASKGGAPDHPGWYKNLLAHPDVEIQVRDRIIPVRARTATAAEKERLWPIMTTQWPGYDDYQPGTKRDIPVVVLTPAEPGPLPDEQNKPSGVRTALAQALLASSVLEPEYLPGSSSRAEGP